jgi:hypothetical protein
MTPDVCTTCTWKGSPVCPWPVSSRIGSGKECYAYTRKPWQETLATPLDSRTRVR